MVDVLVQLFLRANLCQTRLFPMKVTLFIASEDIFINKRQENQRNLSVHLYVRLYSHFSAQNNRYYGWKWSKIHHPSILHEFDQCIIQLTSSSSNTILSLFLTLHFYTTLNIQDIVIVYNQTRGWAYNIVEELRVPGKSTRQLYTRQP